MARPKYIQAKKTTLKSPITSSETTEILLTELLDVYGNRIVSGDLNSVTRLTFNPGGSTEEIIEFTDFTLNDDGSVSIDTGIARGRAAVSLYASGGTAYDHSAGEVVVLSNNPQMYEEILDYIDGVAIAGAPDASNTAKGLLETATTAEIDSDTDVGATGAELAVTPDKLALSKYGTRLPTANEKAALAGTGTPSSGNKFVTADTLAAAVKFGGDGSDGALSIDSGTTTIDLGGSQVVIKNYTSIAITGTGKLAFSNPHANGTTIILKSQGAVTLTSSQAPMIDASGIGASAGNNGYSPAIFKTVLGGSASAYNSPGAGGTIPTLETVNSVKSSLLNKYHQFCPGAGGGGGSKAGGGGGASVITAGGSGSNGTNAGSTGTDGSGGRGGGALIIECGGALNFTTASGISVAGSNAVAASGSSNLGGGGGGGGGCCGIFYNSLTANSGTITVSGGTHGTAVSGGGDGGNGGTGFSLVAANTELY